MNETVLLSIKPKYVDAILSGEKHYEFRKAIFRSDKVKTIYMYSSSPVKKIVAKFELKDILKGTPSEIWEECSDFGGISKKDFFDYYQGKTSAFSLKISDLEIFKEAICPYEIFNKFTPPQSFMYFDNFVSKI